MKREILEKAIQMRDEILQIERMSSVMATGVKAHFEFVEGGYGCDPRKSIAFSEKMTTKMVSMLQEYKLELEKEIEEL